MRTDDLVDPAERDSVSPIFHHLPPIIFTLCDCSATLGAQLGHFCTHSGRKGITEPGAFSILSIQRCWFFDDDDRVHRTFSMAWDESGIRSIGATLTREVEYTNN